MRLQLRITEISAVVFTGCRCSMLKLISLLTLPQDLPFFKCTAELAQRILAMSACLSVTR